MTGNETASPQPVPDLAAGPYPRAVTDEDRNRYGVLLDHAAERGLLSPAEYQVRLAELAEADVGRGAAAHRHRTPGVRRRGSASAAVPPAPRPAAGARRSARPRPRRHPVGRPHPGRRAGGRAAIRGSCWPVVVAVLLVALVGARPGGRPTSSTPTTRDRPGSGGRLSSLRL